MIQVVLTTFANANDAETAVRTLVDENLAACGTLIPGARSIYRWEGRVEDAGEIVVLLKTSRAADLTSRLGAIHPYETPEILTFDSAAAPGAYARWVESACTTSAGKAS
jgi:periplasmic divalent cation tolerance protein